jgi:hypothetical protein
MATSAKARPAWAEELLRELKRPVSEGEKAILREMARTLRTLRDASPSIAPDTTGQYVRETREELDSRP